MLSRRLAEHTGVDAVESLLFEGLLLLIGLYVRESIEEHFVREALLVVVAGLHQEVQILAETALKVW